MRIKTPVLRSLNRLCTSTKFSDRRIAEILSIAPNTVGFHRKQFEKAGLEWKTVRDMDDATLISKLVRKKSTSKKKVMPDWQSIHERKSKNKYLTLEALHQEYCGIHKKNAYGRSQFSHYYRKYVKTLDISMRLRRYPAEATVVDFTGTLIPWRNPQNKGKVEKAQIFVAVLGFSSLTFAIALKSQKIPDFIIGHVKAYEYFGGVTEILIPDNLKSAVTRVRPELVLQKDYVKMAEYYDTEILPARVRRPQDKAVAEQGVLYVSRWIIAKLLERTFFSLEEINEAIAPLLEEINSRPMKNYDGSRRSRFEEVEKDKLKPLPSKPYEYTQWFTEQKVPSDYHVKIDKHFYSVPFDKVTEYVEGRATNNVVEIFHQNKRIATHVRSYDVGGFTTDKKHMTPEHFAYAEQSKEIFLKWASTFGPATIDIVRAQYRGKYGASMAGNKACSSLKGLAVKYEPYEIEAACLKALNISSPNISSIRSILRTGLFKVNEESLSSQMPLPMHENVRGADYYQLGGV